MAGANHAHQGLDLHPALSPQGDAVAYVSDRTGAFEIYVRALRGTATDTPLTNDGGQNVQPAWSPDGRYFGLPLDRRGGIWLIPARGGVPRQVAAAGSNPAWSPDGTRLAFQSDEHADVTPTAWLATSGSTIWVVDADGHNARELTRLGSPLGGHASPTWSTRWSIPCVYRIRGRPRLRPVAVEPREQRCHCAGAGPRFLRTCLRTRRPLDLRRGRSRADHPAAV